MAWITEHAPLDADLSSCVTCGLCLPVCPTFRLTGDESASPRGRLAAIAAVGQGVADVDQRFDDITGFCLQCRACETACPSMVPYGSIIESARAEVIAQRPSRGSSARRLMVGRILAVAWLLRLGTLLIAVLQRLRVLRFVPGAGSSAAGLRRIPIPVKTARGGAWGDPNAQEVVLFTGCVADAWFSDVHRASIEVLLRAGYRVTAADAQTCCGALAAHGGFADDADRLARRNISALASADLVAVDVAGCGAHLKGFGQHGADGARVADRTRDVSEIVAAAIDEGRLPRFEASGELVAIQDPCHLEHGQGITAEPRAIVEAAGYTVVDADAGGLCCGAGGLYQLEYPETADELGEAKAASVVATGATIVASANAGCEMQLRRFLGSKYRVVHPIELYAEKLRGTGAPQVQRRLGP